MWYRRCGAEYLQLTIGWVSDFPTQRIPEEMEFYRQIVERKLLQIGIHELPPKSIYSYQIYMGHLPKVIIWHVKNQHLTNFKGLKLYRVYEKWWKISSRTKYLISHHTPRN